ncbi:MAG: response regulator [Chromatiaceae bacterium]|nr:response regulator [Chromatiaceae bacterium]
MASLRLLIAEDDASLQRMLHWEFEELGYRVITASTCAEALCAVADRGVDLALIDYHLPDGFGTDLLDALRRHDHNLPIIVYSGYASPAETTRIQQSGADHFLSKPVTAQSLHALFARLCFKRSARPGQ